MSKPEDDVEVVVLSSELVDVDDVEEEDDVDVELLDEDEEVDVLV